MTDKKRTAILTVMVTVCCGIMAIVDGVIQPEYAVKSIVKIALFLICPAIYLGIDKELKLREIFRPNKKGMKIAFSLCIPVYIVILGAYLLLKDVFDFSAITTSLTGNIGVNKSNFIFVALYISFINSLLEEFFFRGFLFTNLKTKGNLFANLFSAAVFAATSARTAADTSLPLIIVAMVIPPLPAGRSPHRHLPPPHSRHPVFLPPARPQ